MSETSQAFVSATSTCNHKFLSKIQLLVGGANTLKEYLTATDEICGNIITKIGKISTKNIDDNANIDKYEY